MVLVDTIGESIDELNPKKFKQPNFFIRVVKNLTLIAFFSVVVFATINLPAYLIIGEYKFNPENFSFGFKEQEQLEIASKTGVYKPTTQYPDNSLFIPKIGVSAPIVYDVEADSVMKSLRDGVVHLRGSGHIGRNGNIFITGHSSNYWWEEGQYNTVFALLPELSEGDLIYLTDSGKLKRYKVKEKIEVKKNEVDSYLTSGGEQLTLMTCVPVGTNLKRLLVIAVPD
jgi:LPXTG-site transpeptidase (sortase) family protein